MSDDLPKQSAWTHAHSAGGVVLHREEGKSVFLAIKPRGQGRLQLPKGTVDHGETAEQTAVREVREETGVRAEIVLPIDNISYFFRSRGRGIRKQVDFYLMRFLGGSTDDHDHEVDEAIWISADAVDRLTFESERDVVRKALALAAEPHARSAFEQE